MSKTVFTNGIRLGAASMTISISDAEGLVVRHGSDPDWVLASKPAAECDTEWEQIWELLEKMGVERT